MKLERDFYTRGTLTVAEDILGKTLVHVTPEGVTKGKIVEVEAYLGPDDRAAHSFHGRSKRTEIQYGEGGYVYVYLIYGMYICMNIVTNRKDKPEVLLLRALEPLEGLDLMKRRRKTEREKLLCSGPGRLTQAMGITMGDYGADLCGDSLYLETGTAVQKQEILRTKRINIDYAGEARDYLWRFLLKDNPYVSGGKVPR